MKRIFLMGWVALAAVQADSQPFIDIASVAWQQWHEKDNGEGSTSWLTGQLSLPYKAGADVFLANPSFERYDLPLPDPLYGISLPLVWVHKLNDRHKITGTVIPRISSDLTAGKSDDYQLGGALLLSFIRSERLQFKAGAYYNSEFFGFYMIPLAGIDWKIDDRWRLTALLPRSGLLEYKLLPGRLHGGLSFRGITASFRTDPHQYIKVYDGQLKLFLDAYLAKNLVIGAEGGRSFFRKYEAGVRLNGENTETDLAVEDRPLFRIVLAYRIRLDGE